MTLICFECGETSEDAKGWKAEFAVTLVDGYEFGYEFDVDGLEVTVFCPTCWSREFADA